MWRDIEDDKSKFADFCSAIDEGDASPDVNDFDEERFIQELKDGWRKKSD